MTGTARCRPCFFMFEQRRQPLLPRKMFYVRFARGASIGLLIILGSLVTGLAGYHWFERIPWLDAFVNAAMILSGMGPVAQLQTSAGKLFGGCYQRASIDHERWGELCAGLPSVPAQISRRSSGEGPREQKVVTAREPWRSSVPRPQALRHTSPQIAFD